MKNSQIMYYRNAIRTSMLLVSFTALGLLLLCGCGRKSTGELSGVVQLAKEVNSEGILIFIPGTEYRAYTNENGAFLITHLSPGEYTVVSQSEGFEESRETVHVLAGQRASIGPVILQKPYQPNGNISGFITLEGQNAHDGIMVLLIGTTYTCSTNTTGYFEFSTIPPGVYQLLALKENWVPATKNNIQVTDGQETKISKIQLQAVQEEPAPLPDPPSLGERILQGSAFLEGEENHSGIRASLIDIPAKFAITDASGSFLLTELDEKPHTILLSHEGYLFERIADAYPIEATSTNSCGFVTLQREYRPGALGVLQGRIYLEGQEEHGNITVRLQGITQAVYTDSQGRYKFVGVPENKYVLTAERPGYETGKIEDVIISANQVILAPDLTLTSIQTEEQEGTGGIAGLAMLEGETDQGGVLAAIEGTSFTAVTGANGQFQFTDVPVGAYTLIFTISGYKTHYLDGVPVLLDQNTALEPVILEKDVDPPYVIDSFPRNGSQKIPVDQFIDVIVRFSERMEAGSVKSSVIIEPPAAFEAFFDRESDLSDFDTLHVRLHHDPSSPLMFNTRYQVVITPQARTPKGVPMDEPFIFSFKTDGPLIVDSIPRKGESELFLNNMRKVLFVTNAPVDQQRFERAIRIRPKPDSQPIFQFMPMGMGTQILIEADWRANTRYRIQLGNDMRTMDRQRFSNTPFSLNFRAVYIPGFEQPQVGNRTGRVRGR